MGRHAGLDKSGEVIAVFEGWVVKAWRAGRLSGSLGRSVARCHSIRALRDSEAAEIGKPSLDRVALAHRRMAEGIYTTREKLDDGLGKVVAGREPRELNLGQQGGRNA